ncbi:MAG: hypothetical protein ACK5NF_03445 [Bacilli bacterium]
MKRNLKSMVAIGLCCAMFSVNVIPAYAMDTSIENVSIINQNSLESILESDGVTQLEWDRYVQDTKEGIATEANERGVVSAAKTAVKFLVKHLDEIPSKTIRNLFEKYGSKIISAIDTVEVWTCYGIASALTAFEVPDSAADLIADFIVTFIL